MENHNKFLTINQTIKNAYYLNQRWFQYRMQIKDLPKEQFDEMFSTALDLQEKLSAFNHLLNKI